MTVLAATLPIVLAAPDWGQLVGIAFIVLSFLSWFVKQLKGGNGAQAAERPVPADKPLRAEIEVFLEEVKRAPAQNPQRPEPVERREPGMPREAKGPRKPPGATKAKAEKTRKTRPEATAEPSTTRPKPISQLAQNHLSTAPLGEAVRTHLTGHMGDRMSAEAQQHLGQRIPEEVQRMFGQSAIEGTESASMRRGEKHPLLLALAQPGAVRQSLVLAEILQRPRALRRTLR